MRGISTVLVAVAMMGGAAAQAQPTANTVAAAEVAFHCSEILVRADEMANFGLYAPGEPQPSEDQLYAIEERYELNLPVYAAAAGYDAAQIPANRQFHSQKITPLKSAQIRENVDACARGEAPIPQHVVMDVPTAGFALAMAGRGANDVLYVDVASLYRIGGSVAGWQLYIFRSDQMVDGKPAKAQWTPFRVSCIGQPEIATYGSIWLADPRTNAPPVATKRGAANRKPVTPDTFGAATWMIACDVNPPTAGYSTLAGAADHAKAQFAQ
jgi:hypothetical protein